MWKEFKEFAIKGNVIDMAIGIIIGAAFSKVVNSLVGDVLMPPIGMIIGKIDFADLFVSLTGKSYPSLEVAKEAGAPTINYGVFFTTLLDFLVIAFVMFLVVRELNQFHRKRKKVQTVTTKPCPYCYEEIHIKAQKCPRCTADLSTHHDNSLA